MRVGNSTRQGEEVCFNDLLPMPRRPSALLPIVYMSPVDVINPQCSSPQLIELISTLNEQNLGIQNFFSIRLSPNPSYPT